MVDAPETVQDAEYDPAVEPSSSRAWLNRIVDAEKALREYQTKSDNIDKLYANLNRLSSDNRDREFQMFWANIQVLGPSIYARPPAPVVTPRFQNQKPIPMAASELLERSITVSFEQEDIDGTMRLIRDDLSVLARGVAWCRYESKQESGTYSERVCIEHVDRKDFLHEPARKWQEVDWVAKRSWLTRREMRKRFRKTSGDAYQGATFETQKEDRDNGAADPMEKAGVWEIWSKGDNKVLWVTEGVDVLLDEDKPHLTLDNFFPCPKPAYGTVQRRSLVPVPDMVFYKDQLEEINELTGRIHALADAIKVRFFYPSGAGEIGDAVEAAVKSHDDRSIGVPISNWAALGELGTKDVIIWMPIEMIANTIVQLVTLRKQLIDDVYQITGLSDIMRGATDPNETLGAQELKSQYGSVRVRDRQDELVRVARDLTRIVAEIMSENFQGKTLLDMSQMELPTDADIAKQIKPLEAQAKQIPAMLKKQIDEAHSDPETMKIAQEKPELAQQAIQKAQQQAQQQVQQIEQQIEQLKQTVTIDEVMDLLKEQRTRPFVLDIETDSTIAPDENMQKQRATEFMTAFGGFLNQAMPAVQVNPAIAPLMADMMKFVASQFRAGRELSGSIQKFADQMAQAAQQPQGNPEADKAKQEAELAGQAHQADMQAKAMDAKTKAESAQLDAKLKTDAATHAAQMREFETGEKVQAIRLQSAQQAQKHEQDMQLGQLDIRKKELEVEKLSGQIVAESQRATISAAEADQRMSHEDQRAATEASRADQQADHAQQAFEQTTALNAAAAKESPNG